MTRPSTLCAPTKDRSPRTVCGGLKETEWLLYRIRTDSAPCYSTGYVRIACNAIKPDTYAEHTVLLNRIRTDCALLGLIIT